LADKPRLKALKPKQLLYQTVQEAVKSYIIENGLKAGDALPPETELAQQLEVSRNSVREAIKALEALGILEARSGTGLFVRDFSFDAIVNNLAYGMLFDLKHLTDVLEVRCHLEESMVEKVVQRATPEQIQHLRTVLERMGTAAEQGRYSAEADRAFHQHLYDNVNNLLLWKVLDIFWDVIRQAQEYAAMPGPADPMASYRVHLPIVDALEQGDVDEMRAAILRHYGGIEERLRRYQARWERK
jgi:DNA-binding FadR family transcriptional regulator